MMRPHRIFPIALLLGWLALSGSSCRDESEVQRIPAGLKIQSAIPAFPDVDVFPPNYVLYDVSWPAGLRYELNEAAAKDEIALQFFPPVQGDWSHRVSSTSGILWVDDYTPQASAHMQRVLIDGPRFVRPWLHEFLVRERASDTLGILEAHVFHRFTEGPKLLNALLLLFDEQTAATAQRPSDLFALGPSTAVLADFDASEGSEQRAMRIVDHLERGSFYTLAAILDTNGDGVYDPSADWWGTSRVVGTPNWTPLFVPAVFVGPDIQIFKLEAEMLPPELLD